MKERVDKIISFKLDRKFSMNRITGKWNKILSTAREKDMTCFEEWRSIK